MNRIYDFNSYDPPVVSARSLERIRKRRTLELHMLLLTIAAALFEACAVAAAIYLCSISLSYGVACAAALCFLQISGGIILVTFLKNRKYSYLLYS